MRRHVRVHLVDNLPSVEGLLRSYRTGRYGAHYVLEVEVKVHESEQHSYTLDGRSVRIPRERVAFIQEL